MKKKTKNVRELINAYNANRDRIQEIHDASKAEKRELSEAENQEFSALVRENQMLQMDMHDATSVYLRENPNAREEAVKIIRENAKNGKKTEITFVRDLMVVTDVTSGALVPLNIQDILKPLEEGFILDKVGLSMPTGLSGDYVWPAYEMVEAQIAGEGVALTDTKIPFSKLQAQPERIGIAIPVSNQSLNQSQGVLETIVREVMPQSIRLLLNKILFSTQKVNNATHLVGPFVAAAENPVALSKVPTFAELNAEMKAAVLEKGIDGEHLCWTMSKSQAAILEGTPINKEGIYVPMIQNDVLCGLPIYTTNAIREVVVTYKKKTSSGWEDYTLAPNDEIKGAVTSVADLPTSATTGHIYKVTTITEFIGLGDWRYQVMGLFGDIRFIVDPYSQARKDAVDFVLNCDYGTKTLRPEAFILGKVGAKSA